MSVLLLLGLIGVVGLSAVVTGWKLLFTVAWLMAAVLVFSYAWTRLAVYRLRILWEPAAAHVEVGGSLGERFGIRNPLWLPRLFLEVFDSGNLPGRARGRVVSVAPKAERRWRERTVCSVRGLYKLGPVVVSVADPFGLFRRSVEAGESRRLLVFPQIVTLPEFAMPALEMPGGLVARGRGHHSTPTVAGVRDYVAGDTLGRVHWKATARHQKLMVKEFDFDPAADVWLVLDLDRKFHIVEAQPDCAVPPPAGAYYMNSTVEYAVTVAASIGAAMLGRGRSVGLLINSTAATQAIPPDRGSRQLWKMLEQLAVAAPSGSRPLQEALTSHQSFFLGNQALLVVTPDTSGRWMAALESASGRRMPVTAVMIDSTSFDRRALRPLPLSSDVRGDFVSYRVRNGDRIESVLAQHRTSGGVEGTGAGVVV